MGDFTQGCRLTENPPVGSRRALLFQCYFDGEWKALGVHTLVNLGVKVKPTKCFLSRVLKGKSFVRSSNWRP